MTSRYLLIVVFVQVISDSSGYYWRDYNGKVPYDAFVAGTDVNNQKIYIGQAFGNSKGRSGVFTTSIQEGKEVNVPLYGVKKAMNFVQILCGQDPDNFHWFPANATHLHLFNTDHVIVRGGVEDNKWLNIGRVNYQGGISIGKILAGNLEGADMWFVHNNDELKTKTYEVLTYNDVATKIDFRNNWN